MAKKPHRVGSVQSGRKAEGLQRRDDAAPPMRKKSRPADGKPTESAVDQIAAAVESPPPPA